MIIIEKTKKTDSASIYPDAGFLSNYKDSDFASFISTLQVDAILGMNIRRLGNSGVYISLTQTGNKEEKGIEELKQAAKIMLKLSKEAISSMTDEYVSFYLHFLDDFEQNGLIMPVVGKIL